MLIGKCDGLLERYIYYHLICHKIKKMASTSYNYGLFCGCPRISNFFFFFHANYYGNFKFGTSYKETWARKFFQVTLLNFIGWA